MSEDKLADKPVAKETGSDRRKYRRIHAPVYCRPAGVDFLVRQRQPIDISMGGLRIYSDTRFEIGELLKLEFFVPDLPPTVYTAEVVWIESLPPDSAAGFDVGLKFIQLEPEAARTLMTVLGPPVEHEDPPPSRK
jgi:Tfp pilus assembly protein PilZ